jgi:hypothetical protein
VGLDDVEGLVIMKDALDDTLTVVEREGALVTLIEGLGDRETEGLAVLVGVADAGLQVQQRSAYA